MKLRDTQLCVVIRLIYTLGSSWSPLSLDTSNTRKDIWYPQPSPYPATDWQQNMQNHIKRKKVSIEHTPPIKHTYTPPSIKVLFGQNQCKSSLRKFATKYIKTYSYHCKNNMIYNLSDYTLAEDEFSVLTKGLSFIPIPIKTFKQEVNKSWNKLKKNTLQQNFFRNIIHDKPPPFKTKSNWIPSPYDKLTLVNFYTRIEQELTSINTPCWQAFINQALKEKTALNNLKNNQSIVIKPCNKGGDIWIMNTRDYLIKIYKQLQDHNTYKPVTHNPTSATANDTFTLIQYMHFQQTDKDNLEFLLPTKNTHTPFLYGLLKIHKGNCPFRPVVSGCDGPTNHLSAYITHFIQLLGSNFPSHIKNTKHFLILIEILSPLSFNALLVTADVTSLYAKILHEDGIAAMIHFIEKCSHLLP